MKETSPQINFALWVELSTIFDFMSGKSKCPKVITIKKICTGANITLKELFDREYFNSVDDVY